jgi:hypothetical protein
LCSIPLENDDNNVRYDEILSFWKLRYRAAYWDARQ